MRIAIIGSDYALLQLLRLILEDEGHEMYSFLDPADAVDWLKKEPRAPDLLFVDFMFPPIDGKNLPALLQEPKFKTVCKILIGIVPPKQENVRFWDYFLKNPFTIKKLFDVVKECTEKKG